MADLDKHRVRQIIDGELSWDELTPDYVHVASDWTSQLHEWFRPGCNDPIDVDAVPTGYPVFNPFEPDVDTFYDEWPDRPAPDGEQPQSAT